MYVFQILGQAHVTPFGSRGKGGPEMILTECRVRRKNSKTVSMTWPNPADHGL